MGNQITALAPSQILPVDNYFSPEYDFRYESSMGSTRFLKVARAKSEEGNVVVKVFVKHDPTLPLEPHLEKIEKIKRDLASAVNCLPFQKVMINERAGLVVREFVKHSLYDRVSTRPFLTTIEKKWITFQVLCALNQCHKQKICHGDIKLENILITSWNWVLLSDFASFKPTYLPEDNPADYSYFFDTSRRRTCYIAPERFVKTMTNEPRDRDSPLVGDGPCYSGNLLPEMDIFSAGCALLELWTEGSAPFEFSQLLTYRNGDNELVTKHLQSIKDINLRNLLTSMLHINPKERRSAEIYLDQERGRLFPEYFYSFLQSYVQMFTSIPATPNDEKIDRLSKDIHTMINYLSDKKIQENLEENSKEICEKPENSDDDGLILATAVVTSCIRGLNHTNSKISCLETLLKLAQHTASDVILDRILPYILHFAQDASPNVRVSALDCLTESLCLVKDLPRSDANVFPEYVLPSIAPLATDSSVIVRIAYARNIATLAETAVNFLEQSQLNCTPEMPMPSYENELNTLHEMLHQTVMSLLTDSQSIVKQTLMESGITKLCVFFGRQKANDVILSHIITFLNDKEDKNLRATFFDCIVGIAAYVGFHCSPILIPLLQQGLSDPEEFIIAKSIRAITALQELGLLQKISLTEFISECACYLNHPNLWIRHEVCGLVSVAAKTLSALDVQCKIMPAIVNHLKCPLIQVEKPELLLDSLHPPVPRNIYTAVLRFQDINELMETLEERKKARTRMEGGIPKYSEFTSTAMRQLFRRLQSSEGMNDLVENQILSMRNHLIKLHRYKRAESQAVQKDGKIVLDRKFPSICHELLLIDRKQEVVRKRKDTEPSENWFGAGGDQSTSSPQTPLAGTLNVINPTPSSSLVEYSMPEKNFFQEKVSECRMELDILTSNLKMKYSVNNGKEVQEYPRNSVPDGWKLNGTLVAHLHEHRMAVTRMTSLKPGGPLFASVSADHTVRVWDCNRLDGRQTINRSKQYYVANSALTAIAACDNGNSIAVAGTDGSLMILKTDPNSTKMALQQARHLDSKIMLDRTEKVWDDGPVVDMQTMGTGSVIVYATLYGSIVGWDIRSNKNAFKLESDLRNGVITTFCIDPKSSWLAAGTSSGRHLCWDLRFGLKIAEIKHPYETRIRRIVCNPSEPSCLLSASQGNNDVSSWNIETNSRQTVLWASSSPPFSNNATTNSHSFCALLPGVVDGRGFVVTGGTDQRIRFWDLQDSSNCSLVVPAPKDNLPITTTYDSRPIDGTFVIQEIQNTQNPNQMVGSGGSSSSSIRMEEVPRSGPEMPTIAHHDVITDLVLCRTQKQTFVASSSRDGVIKLWK